MNSDTGQVYRGEFEIAAAIGRGEPVVRVSEQVADAVEIGMLAMNRAERRRAARAKAKRERQATP